MKLTVRQLRVFDAVATLGSVTRAADRLGMSQSAASSALADLQVILGRPLFVHAKGRPVQITEEGRRLRTRVRSLLHQLEDIEQVGDEAPLSGKLVIGATAMIAETVLPRLCVDFMRMHAGVRVQVEAEAVGNLFGRLGRLELETALIEVMPNAGRPHLKPADAEDIELTPWRMDELVLVVAADHPLAGAGRLRIADLSGHAWCTREAGSSTTAQLRYMLHDTLGQLPIAFESTSNWAVRHAVIAGGGIGCLSQALVQFDIDNGRLVRLDMEDFRFTRTLAIARPAGIRRGRLVTAFEAFLRDHGDGTSG